MRLLPARGTRGTVRARNAAALPKGLPCAWHRQRSTAWCDCSSLLPACCCCPASSLWRCSTTWEWGRKGLQGACISQTELTAKRYVPRRSGYLKQIAPLKDSKTATATSVGAAVLWVYPKWCQCTTRVAVCTKLGSWATCLPPLKKKMSVHTHCTLYSTIWNQQ